MVVSCFLARSEFIGCRFQALGVCSFDSPLARRLLFCCLVAVCFMLSPDLVAAHICILAGGRTFNLRETRLFFAFRGFRMIDMACCVNLRGSRLLGVAT